MGCQFAKRNNVKMKPKISVITGYFNRSSALEVTIASIMEQSFEDFEFIVFNDFSTDDTKHKLEEIEKRYNDPRLKVINHDENIGFVSGLINAIALSKGDYICIQGSGDYSYPERLKLQSKALDDDCSIGVVGAFYENYIESSGVARMRNKVSDGMTLIDLLKENVFSHGEVMFRRTFYDQVGGYREEFVNCQDYDLWLRMIKECKFYTVKELLYRRYIRYDGVSYNPDSFLRQVRYACLCRDLAVSDAKRSKELLAIISKENLEVLVPSNEFRVQKQVILAVFRSLIWGNQAEAINLADKGIVSKLAKYLVMNFSRLYVSRVMAPFRHFLNKFLGIKTVL